VSESPRRFDVDRYRRMLADAVDEKKRLALIDLLIEERAIELQRRRGTSPRFLAYREIDFRRWPSPHRPQPSAWLSWG
jgi:hypothetical protein